MISNQYRKLIYLILILIPISGNSQTVYRKPDSFFASDTILNKKKVYFCSATAGLALIGTYTGLGAIWYSGEEKSPFHFFNDSQEWLQMDKVGHAYSAYQVSRIMSQAFVWSGVKYKTATWLGSGIGWLMISPVEIFDGFSPKYGASATDLVANASGSALNLLNGLVWQEQRLQLKFSFHPSGYAQFHTAQLGSTPIEQIFKDYNGQTYWMSVRVHSFLPEGLLKKKYPRWLNLAVGYGGEGMTGGYFIEPWGAIHSREYRQFYLGLDIDLSNIKTRIGFLDAALGVLNMVRIPMPALEFSKKGVKAYGFF